MGVVALAAWHRVPVHPFHRATLVAFGAYLVVYICLLGYVQLNSVSGLRADHLAAQAYLRALDPVAFAATVGVVAPSVRHAQRSVSSAGRPGFTPGRTV